MREARRLGLPVIALVDTNCDPDEADFIIPGNDDAIRSCSLIVRAIADAIQAGQQKVTVEELQTNGAAAQAAPEATEATAPPVTEESPPAEAPTAQEVAVDPANEVLSQGEETVDPPAAESETEAEAAEEGEQS